jgi:hypothetical protein
MCRGFRLRFRLQLRLRHGRKPLRGYLLGGYDTGGDAAKLRHGVMGARGVMVVWLWGLFLLHVLAGEYLLITRGREIDDTCTVLRSFFGV